MELSEKYLLIQTYTSELTVALKALQKLLETEKPDRFHKALIPCTNAKYSMLQKVQI